MRSIKYHFIFMKVAAGFYAGYLFFSGGCNEMFAHSLTFLSRNSKSTNLNALTNFLKDGYDSTRGDSHTAPCHTCESAQVRAPVRGPGHTKVRHS